MASANSQQATVQTEAEKQKGALLAQYQALKSDINRRSPDFPAELAAWDKTHLQGLVDLIGRATDLLQEMGDAALSSDRDIKGAIPDLKKFFGHDLQKKREAVDAWFDQVRQNADKGLRELEAKKPFAAATGEDIVVIEQQIVAIQNRVETIGDKRFDERIDKVNVALGARKVALAKLPARTVVTTTTEGAPITLKPGRETREIKIQNTPVPTTEPTNSNANKGNKGNKGDEFKWETWMTVLAVLGGGCCVLCCIGLAVAFAFSGGGNEDPYGQQNQWNNHYGGY
jgi:hypothetical protein